MNKIATIEFLRIFFSMAIVYFHILHSNIINYAHGVSKYLELAKASGHAGYIVECFFIMSGYFLYLSIQKGKESFLQFLIRKVIRLWPVLAFSTIFIFAFGRVTASGLFSQLLNLLFLQCVGLSLEYKGINWYLSPLFWGLLFYFNLYKILDKQKSIFITVVLIYFAYLANISFTNGGFGRETVWGIVNLGICRAFAGIGLGMVLAVLLERLDYIYIDNINCRVKSILVSFFEIGIFVSLCYYFFTPIKYNAFIVVPLFSILFILFIKREGYFSKALDCVVFSKLGKYSYSIYVMQQTSFWILQRTLWKSTIVNHVAICLTLSLLFSFIIGCITYYLIEKPARKILKIIEFNSVSTNEKGHHMVVEN